LLEGYKILVCFLKQSFCKQQDDICLVFILHYSNINCVLWVISTISLIVCLPFKHYNIFYFDKQVAINEIQPWRAN